MLAAHNIATYSTTARRYKSWLHGSYASRAALESTSTTRYYAPSFEREISNGQTTDYTYIESPNGLIAAVKRAGNKQDVMLLATDHLGSIVAVWNTSGTLLEEHRYTAWGQRTSSTASPRLRRGFTGHEHLAQFGIIDMQARLYDPHLGRFLAPDPYVQAPENPMNYNRYAYCFNNPLKYTDPTGCLIEEEFREILDEMHRLLDEANRMDQQLCVSFDGFGGGASGFGSVGGQLYSYDNGVASLTDVGMPFYHMHEGATVHGRYNADGSWITTRVDLPSWWGTVPDAGGNSWNPTNVGGWNVNWADNWHGGGGSGTGGGGGCSSVSASGADKRATPIVGTKWQSGMPTVYGTGANALVVSTKKNVYVNIMSESLETEFDDIYRKKTVGPYWSPVADNRTTAGMLALVAVLSNPFSTFKGKGPVPTFIPIGIDDVYNDLKSYDNYLYNSLAKRRMYYYKRYGIIK